MLEAQFGWDQHFAVLVFSSSSLYLSRKIHRQRLSTYSSLFITPLAKLMGFLNNKT